MEHEGEEFDGVGYNFLEGLQNFFRTQLHNLTAEVDDPNDLLIFPEY